MRNNPAMPDDPFSDVLRLVSARSVMSGGLAAGGRWAVRVPPSERINFWGILRGAAWLVYEDGTAPLRVVAGDVFLRSVRQPVLLAGDLDAATLAAPLALADVIAGKVDGISRIGDGGDFFMVGGKVEVDPAAGRLLLDALPAQIHIGAASPHAPVLHWLFERLVRERAGALPGAGAALAQLAHLLFIQILRAHLDETGPGAAPGWLRAAGDPRLAPALRRMHAEPGRAWRLEELAQEAGMSRASFALHFKRTAGIAPLAYLARWRMRLAEQMLRRRDTPVAVLAARLGYGSESAFSNAFKRITGQAPQRYRAGLRAAGPDVPSASSQRGLPANSAAM